MADAEHCCEYQHCVRRATHCILNGHNWYAPCYCEQHASRVLEEMLLSDFHCITEL